MKFETGRHGQNLLTKAPPSGGYPKYLQIWDKQKSTFLTRFFNFGHEGVPNVTKIAYDALSADIIKSVRKRSNLHVHQKSI